VIGVERSIRPVHSKLLGTALLAALPLLAACDTGAADPFVITETGALEGFVFWDADRDGRFDPSAGDSVLPGVRVSVRQRATQQTLAGGQATTGAGGRFRIDALPLGTHDLYVDTLALPVGMRLCQNPVGVSVYRGETGFRNLNAVAACLISIAEAKTRPQGTFVVIRGIVTVRQGAHRNDNTYIQDRTTGIQIFGLPALGLAVGDSVEVSGVMASFQLELQINQPVIGRLGEAVGTIEPRPATGRDVADIRWEGELLRLQNVEVTAVQTGTASGYNVNMRDEAGAAFEIRVEGGLIPSIPHATWQVGSRYDLIGVLGRFQTLGQLKLRSADEIVRR
jgi:hypothetical protein